VRTLGTGRDAVILLHGMMASGDSFGARYDALARDRRLVVPDLLGFGRSMNAADRHDLDAHLDALDAMSTELGIENGRWSVGGHSMGGMLALHWAARHVEQVERVVTWGAPLQTSREAAMAAIDRMGWLERLFVLDTPLSRAVCAWSCEHRELAGWLASATNPEMPVPLARQSSLHTWQAYRGALEDVILAPDWQAALTALAAQKVPVVLGRGADDPVADPGVMTTLARRYSNVELLTHPSAGHELPLSDPWWCVRQLIGR